MTYPLKPYFLKSKMSYNISNYLNEHLKNISIKYIPSDEDTATMYISADNLDSIILKEYDPIFGKNTKIISEI